MEISADGNLGAEQEKCPLVFVCGRRPGWGSIYSGHWEVGGIWEASVGHTG